MTGSRLNQELLLALIMVLAVLGLYSLAGTSDRLEPLMAMQRVEVIARQTEAAPSWR